MEREGFAIREFLRILKRDGILFIEVFGKEDMRYGGIEVEKDTFPGKMGLFITILINLKLKNC